MEALSEKRNKIYGGEPQNMKVQVLVASTDQTDHSLIEKMNIQTDAIVGNQCKKNSIEKFEYKGYSIQYLNFAERGVGLNRNNALMRATGDICLFADDDMVYVDGYEKIVRNAFKRYPNADIIIFNLLEKSPTRYVIKRKMKVNYLNYLRYGTARIAVRLDVVRRNAVYFNQCFGGGTKHSHGEDNLFLTECLNKKMNIIALPAAIAELTDERPSTWNHGYGEKYMRDQGVLYRAISERWWRLLCFQDAVRHHNEYRLTILEAYKKFIYGGRK